MSLDLKTFGEIAKGLARNPLGIIALFIVLVEGIAALVVGLSSSLGSSERLLLTWFVVLFPVFVLGIFAWLVSRHPEKLYSPRDFNDETNYIRMLFPNAVTPVPAVAAEEANMQQKITRSVAEASDKGQIPVTAILFPWVIYTGDGYLDSGFSIVNAAADPPLIGTVGQSGDVVIYFWRSGGGPNPAPVKIATNLKPGQTTTFVLSQLGLPFKGYAIAICGFPFGHGYASILGPANTMHGYLGTIITARISDKYSAS